MRLLCTWRSSNVSCSLYTAFSKQFAGSSSLWGPRRWTSIFQERNGISSLELPLSYVTNISECGRYGDCSPLHDLLLSCELHGAFDLKVKDGQLAAIGTQEYADEERTSGMIDTPIEAQLDLKGVNWCNRSNLEE